MVNLEFDTMLIAGAVPLGILVSLFISVLKSLFQLPPQAARSVVAVAGLIYFVASSIQDLSFMGIVTGIVAGASLVFSSGGFYDWLGFRIEGKKKP